MAALGLTPDPEKELTARRIGGLLSQVDDGLGGLRLAAPVEIVVVGGAAVAMQWNPRRVTYDVDVVSEGIPAGFWGVVAAVAEAEKLDDDWLNAAARVKAPTGPTPGEPTELYRGSHLRVYGASPHFVLAMKLLSGRGVDRPDIPALLEASRPRSRDELYDLVERAYPNVQIPAATRYIIEQVWADYAAAHPERVQRGEGTRREHRVSLAVQPTLNQTAGWDVAIRTPEGVTLRRSGLYPTKDAAEAAARFAVDVVDVHFPLRFSGSPRTATYPPKRSRSVSSYRIQSTGWWQPPPTGSWWPTRIRTPRRRRTTRSPSSRPSVAWSVTPEGGGPCVSRWTPPATAQPCVRVRADTTPRRSSIGGP